jgi:hypothetical protein
MELKTSGFMLPIVLKSCHGPIVYVFIKGLVTTFQRTIALALVVM